MELYSTAWHVYSVFIVFYLGALILSFTRGYFNATNKRVFLIYLWHSFFCVVYALYSIYNPADSTIYFIRSLNYEYSFELGVGSQFIYFFTSIWSQVFGFSYLGVFLVYNIIGSVGLVAFDSALRAVTWDKSNQVKFIATLIIFLPSISFWTTGLGKDAIAFMAMSLSLWASLQLSKRTLLMFFAILIMLLVRPHIAGIMVIALSSSFMIERGVSAGLRLFLGAVSLLATVMMVPFALSYAGVGGDSAVDVMEYVEGRQALNLSGGSSVDISSMSLPVKLFTYLFRPLPFEARSIPALAASLDNIILLLLFAFGAKNLFIKSTSEFLKLHNRYFLWIYCILTWCILAMTTANLGIAMRQKWMFAPMLIFLLISLIGRSDTVRNEG